MDTSFLAAPLSLFSVSASPYLAAPLSLFSVSASPYLATPLSLFSVSASPYLATPLSLFSVSASPYLAAPLSLFSVSASPYLAAPLSLFSVSASPHSLYAGNPHTYHYPSFVFAVGCEDLDMIKWSKLIFFFYKRCFRSVGTKGNNSRFEPWVMWRSDSSAWKLSRCFPFDFTVNYGYL